MWEKDTNQDQHGGESSVRVPNGSSRATLQVPNMVFSGAFQKRKNKRTNESTADTPSFFDFVEHRKTTGPVLSRGTSGVKSGDVTENGPSFCLCETCYSNPQNQLARALKVASASIG